MGYTFYIVSKEKPISQNDFDTAMVNLSKFNKQGLAGLPVCDVHFDNPNFIRLSGSFGVSGQYAEGFVLNTVICLLDLDYKPKVLSRDWEYGTKEDWEWFDFIRNNQSTAPKEVETKTSSETNTELPECTLTDAELVAKIDEWNGKLCKTGGRAWCLRVPPDPNNDPDLLIAQLCKRFENLLIRLAPSNAQNVPSKE